MLIFTLALKLNRFYLYLIDKCVKFEPFYKVGKDKLTI